MKRSFLQITVLSTILLVAGSKSFGDSKIRIGSGGFNRSQAGNQSSQSGSLAGRLGNLSGGNGNRHVYPATGGTTNGPVKPFPGRQGNFVKPDFKVTLPGHLLKQNGNVALPPNGITVKPIAIDVAQILKHKGPSGQVQPQIQQIMGSAPKHLCGHPHFSWWVNVCHDHCHTHYGCWNTNVQYWDCWTPCNWQVVQCQQFTWYVGLSGIHIPDMQAYGVQSVVNGSPAQLSGLQNGDLILTVNGQTVFDPNLINGEIPKGRLDLQVIRQGSPTPLLLTVFPRQVQTVSF